jgi:hypothetical protein
MRNFIQNITDGRYFNGLIFSHPDKEINAYNPEDKVWRPDPDKWREATRFGQSFTSEDEEIINEHDDDSYRKSP